MARDAEYVAPVEAPWHGFVRCECGYYVERCCVPGCQFPRLAVAATCYGHTVDESDPRHIPTTHNDGTGANDE